MTAAIRLQAASLPLKIVIVAQMAMHVQKTIVVKMENASLEI